MSVFARINTAVAKALHQHDGQFLSAKAYRGVPYVEARHDNLSLIGQGGAHRQLTYRGLSYAR